MRERGMGKKNGEPFGRKTVQEIGGKGHRRPGLAGPSSTKRPCHETHSHSAQARLPDRSEVPARAASGAENLGATAGVPSPSPPRHDQDAPDRSTERRTAHAGHARKKRRRGRPPKKWVVQVRAINPLNHPEFLRPPRHPFAGMKLEDRIEDISTFCARLWARTCEDMARESQRTTRQAA